MCLPFVSSGPIDALAYPIWSTGNTTFHPETSIAEEFQRLVRMWKFETRHLSIPAQITRHPAYRRVIDMGELAIPLILKDLQKEPDHWFSALSEISGESPHIPNEDMGNMKAMSEICIEWGKRNMYVE